MTQAIRTQLQALDSAERGACADLLRARSMGRRHCPRAAGLCSRLAAHPLASDRERRPLFVAWALAAVKAQALGKEWAGAYNCWMPLVADAWVLCELLIYEQYAVRSPWGEPRSTSGPFERRARARSRRRSLPPPGQRTQARSPAAWACLPFDSRLTTTRGVEPMKPQPQFMRIRWEDTSERGGAVTREAMLCLRHRGEIAFAYPSARGSGEMGDACDLCEGRDLRLPGSEPSHTRRSLSANLASAGRSRRPPSNKPGERCPAAGGPRCLRRQEGARQNGGWVCRSRRPAMSPCAADIGPRAHGRRPCRPTPTIGPSRTIRLSRFLSRTGKWLLTCGDARRARRDSNPRPSD